MTSDILQMDLAFAAALYVTMKGVLRKWFDFSYSPSGWLMTMRTPALFVEMPRSTQKR